MGATTDHALGRNLRYFTKKETTAGGQYGTTSQEELAGSDAAKVLNSSIEFTVTRNDRVDSRTTRSVMDKITGKQEISWSCESYLLPAGSSTAPDIDPLIEAAMGGTYGASTANTYKLSDTNALPTCRIARTANGVFREDLFGAYVEELSLSISGGEPPTLSFSGGAFNYALAGTGTTHGSSSVTSTSVPLVTGDGSNFMVGSCININGGSTFVVSKSAADTLVVKTGSYSNNEAIIPDTYSETTTGDPLNGITGSLSLNSDDLPITALDLTLTNNIKAISDESFEKGTTDIVAGFRSVTGTVTVRARKDFLKSFAQRYVQLTKTSDPSFTAIPIVVTIGATSGKRVIVSMLTCELDFGAIDVPESEEALLNIPFTAKGNAGGDELTIAWNQ